MKNDNYIYLYSTVKANFFVQNGIPLLEIGKGSLGQTFYKFLKSEKSKEVNERWFKLYKND